MYCKEKTACFTGHRQIKTNYKLLFSKVYNIVEELIKQNYLYFGTGGSKGFDFLASDVILALKHKYPHIHLILVLPFINQYIYENNWSKEEISHYHQLKEKASKVVHIQKIYSKGSYFKRNRHLIDFSSICICYKYKDFGGTAYTVKYANKKGVKIINCNSK